MHENLVTWAQHTIFTYSDFVYLEKHENHSGNRRCWLDSGYPSTFRGLAAVDRVRIKAPCHIFGRGNMDVDVKGRLHVGIYPLIQPLVVVQNALSVVYCLQLDNYTSDVSYHSFTCSIGHTCL